ncbi:MAG TPA: DUF3866 family protein [Thermaerobacter sp.]
MLRARWGRVRAVLAETARRQELAVEVEGRIERAIAYPDLTGRVRPGDRVWLNTTAVELGLGTGGYHFVIAAPGRQPAPGRGHYMKLRYTPFQVQVEVLEDLLAPLPSGLDGLPVVVAELHSQLAPVLAGWWWAGGGGPVVYVATDGGALPLAFSRLVDRLRRRGWLQVTISAGQAFGGDGEAVNVASALLCARALGARLAVVAMAPGVLGSGSPLGHSGVEQAWALQVAAQLGGRVVAVPRLSEADPRPRHRGLSHHTAAVLGLTGRPVWLPLPRGVPREVAAALSRLAAAAGCVPVDVPTAGAARWLAASGIGAESMGRGLGEDPLFFHAGLAAGIAAAAAGARAPHGHRSQA